MTFKIYPGPSYLLILNTRLRNAKHLNLQQQQKKYQIPNYQNS